MGAVSVASISSPLLVSLVVDLTQAILVLEDEAKFQLISPLFKGHTASAKMTKSFGFSKKFQQHNVAIAMNVVVPSHQLICLYSPTGGDGEPP
jgi:uncharacterized membrane protein YdfJ with MMPL/SSD domain